MRYVFYNILYCFAHAQTFDCFFLVADTVVNLLTFAPMYSLTSGGPNQSTNVLMYEAYKSCFTYADMGRSYTILVILLILVFIVVSLQMKLMKSTDEY